METCNKIRKMLASKIDSHELIQITVKYKLYVVQGSMNICAECLEPLILFKSTVAKLNLNKIHFRFDALDMLQEGKELRNVSIFLPLFRFLSVCEWMSFMYSRK